MLHPQLSPITLIRRSFVTITATALLTIVAVSAASDSSRSPASGSPQGTSRFRKPAPAPAAKVGPPKPAAPAEPWRTWGGPHANFTSTATGLADNWPAAGPPRLWTRKLGDGYSGISEENGILYTAYRRGTDDVVIALDDAVGQDTSGRRRTRRRSSNAGGENIAPGPYAMPQVVGDRIVMASGTGQILSLDKKTGKIVWQHDLYKEFGGTRLGFGYSCHALPYKDTLIVLVGGRAGLMSRITGGTGSAAIAFKQRDGAIAWQNLSFDNAHSSPMLITVDGQPQVVALLAQEVIGFSPDDGAELWRHPHPTCVRAGHQHAGLGPRQHPVRVVGLRQRQPRAGAASGGRQDDGSGAVGEPAAPAPLRQRDSRRRPRLPVRRLQRPGAHDRGQREDRSSGLAAARIREGAAALRRRQADSARRGRHAGARHGDAAELRGARADATAEKIAWTPLTLAGTRLYVRDRTSIVALDLGARPALLRTRPVAVVRGAGVTRLRWSGNTGCTLPAYGSSEGNDPSIASSSIRAARRRSGRLAGARVSIDFFHSGGNRGHECVGHR